MKCISIKTLLFFLFISFMFNNGCDTDSEKNIDVSDINVSLNIKRFDQALFSIPVDSIPKAIPMLKKDFNGFFSLFCSQIIHIGDENYRDFSLLLQKYVSDFNMITAYEDSKRAFPDVADIANDLTHGLKHYKYYFNNNRIPDIYIYMGGFNQSIVVGDHFMGIGLDKYLGKENSFYSRLGMASYQTYKCQKDFIVPDFFRAIAWSDFPYNDSIDNLASNMIYQGKVQYFIDKMLPEISDTLKFGYTSKQWDWCIKSEQSMWDYFIDKKELFTTVQLDIKRYIDDAPFTSTFPHESPGRTGVWIGWRIVCNYMKTHPEVSLEQLMKDNDYQKIMNESKYNP